MALSKSYSGEEKGFPPLPPDMVVRRVVTILPGEVVRVAPKEGTTTDLGPLAFDFFLWLVRLVDFYADNSFELELAMKTFRHVRKVNNESKINNKHKIFFALKGKKILSPHGNTGNGKYKLNWPVLNRCKIMEARGGNAKPDRFWTKEGGVEILVKIPKEVLDYDPDADLL